MRRADDDDIAQAAVGQLHQDRVAVCASSSGSELRSITTALRGGGQAPLSGRTLLIVMSS